MRGKSEGNWKRRLKEMGKEVEKIEGKRERK